MARVRTGARYSSRDAVVAILGMVAPQPSGSTWGPGCDRRWAWDVVRRALPGLCAQYGRDPDRALDMCKQPWRGWREMLDALAYARGCDAPWKLRSPREALALFEVSL